MLDAAMALISIWWFFNTEYFDSWAQVKIGGDQLSISLTALIVLVYIGIGVIGAIRWYYTHRRY